MDAPYPCNGLTAPTTTELIATASPAKQQYFLQTVCENLASIADGTMPEEQIMQEAKILRAEENQRGFGTYGGLAKTLFGDEGLGLVNAPEHGLRSLDVDRFRAWVGRCFTAQNAVATLHNEPPELDALSLLLQGERLAVLAVDPIIEEFPTKVPMQHGVGLLAVVERKPGVPSMVAILHDAATERLRQSMGVSYAPTFDYQPLSGDTASIFGCSDVVPEAASAVPEVFVEELTRLAESGPTPSEVEKQVADYHEARTTAAFEAGHLESTAFELLVDGKVFDRAALDAGFSDLSSEEIQEAAKGLLENSLIGVSFENTESVASIPMFGGFPPDAVPEGETIRFKSHRESKFPDGEPLLVVTDDSITTIFPPTGPCTIKASEIRSVLAWDDGTREVYGPDGRAALLGASHWENYETLRARIDGWAAKVRRFRKTSSAGGVLYLTE